MSPGVLASTIVLPGEIQNKKIVMEGGKQLGSLCLVLEKKIYSICESYLVYKIIVISRVCQVDINHICCFHFRVEVVTTGSVPVLSWQLLYMCNILNLNPGPGFFCAVLTIGFERLVQFRRRQCMRRHVCHEIFIVVDCIVCGQN